MAPATADADCVRAEISTKSIESAATASSKNGPPARSANADGKRRRETEAHFGAVKRAMRRLAAAEPNPDKVPTSAANAAGAADLKSRSYEMASGIQRT